MSSLIYTYRPHLFAADRHYRLEADALAWDSGSETHRVAYRDIEQVRVFKARFLGSSATYWSCVLLPRSGKKIKLSAARRAGFRAVEDHTATYIPFVKELEARIKSVSPGSQLIASRHWVASLETLSGRFIVMLLRVLRHVDLKRSTAVAGWLLRMIGPHLRGHRTARGQLAAAFPKKPAAELEQILLGMWDNFGRTLAEYSHLDELWRFDPDDHKHSRIVMDAVSLERCRALRGDSRPALMFAAHLANWELPPHAAPAFGRHIALVYRAPPIAPLADELAAVRARCVAALIPADQHTPRRILEALKKDWMVGMLVDQHYGPGIEVSFFNRPCLVNPLLARVAQRLDCPIFGSRVIRLPDGKFRFEVTEALAVPRDETGKIDVSQTMQMVTSMIEGWVREHPEQWMWLHKRWRSVD
jgi:Kdo2-lipid IVA lauroyltransferase/acyltransferase